MDCNKHQTATHATGLVICPQCGCPNVHITGVQVHQNKIRVSIDRHRIIRESEAPSSGRGSNVQIGYWCEDGHRWIMSEEFYKGDLTRQMLLGKLGGGLWRD